MTELKEYIEDNRTILALILLGSMLIGVMMYAFMWFLSKDGIEERQKLDAKNKLGYTITVQYNKEGILG